MIRRFLAGLFWPAAVLLYGTIALAIPGLTPQGPGLNSAISSGSTPLSLVYTAALTDNPAVVVSSLETFTSVNVGTAGATRKVIAAFSAFPSAGGPCPPNGLTIGGNAATLVVGNTTGGIGGYIYSAALASGTTATIIIDWTGCLNPAYTIGGVYAVYGSTTQSTGSSNNTSAPTTTFNFADYNVVATGASAFSCSSVTPTNLTSNNEVVGGGNCVLSASNLTTTGSNAFTLTWSSAQIYSVGAFAAFQP